MTNEDQTHGKHFVYLVALGAIGAALAPDTARLVAARVAAGTAISIASFVAPLYISAIAPVAIRGKLAPINQVALTSGIVISYLVDYAFAGSHAWRWMSAMAAIPAAAFAALGIRHVPAFLGHFAGAVELAYIDRPFVPGSVKLLVEGAS